MKRRWLAVVAAGIALGVVVPVVIPAGAPAHAAALFGPGSSLTANPANAPIVLAALGSASAGGTAVATGATTSISMSAALGGGYLGFGTVAAATGAAVGFGVLKMHGLDEGVYVETDPDYAGGASGACPSWGPWPGAYSTFAAAANAAYAGGGAYCMDQVLTFPEGWELKMVATTDFAGGNCAGTPNSVTYEVVTVGTAAITVSPVKLQSAALTGDSWTQSSVNTSYGLSLAPGFTRTHTFSCGSFAPARWFVSATASSGVPLPPWQLLLNGNGHPVEMSGYHGTIRTTLTCTNAAGTNYVMKSERVDVAQGERIPVPPAVCGAGSVATGALVEYQADGSTSWVTIGEGLTPGYVEEWLNDYPDCFNTATQCVLKLWRVGEGGMLASCGEVGQFCPTWAAESVHNPSGYRCTYGSYSVTLEHCSAYRQPGVGVLPNDSGETDSEGKPVPLPVDAPVPDPLPNQMTNPDGSPVEVPGGASSDSRECFPNGWAVFNPVEWVLKPLRCAFEPRASNINNSAALVRAAWSRTAPAKVAAVVAVWEFIPPESGCEGILIDVWFLGPPFRIMQACPGDMLAEMAMWSRIFGVVAMSVYGVVAVSRHVGRIIGYGGLGGGDE